jgi:hypothetical protein
MPEASDKCPTAALEQRVVLNRSVNGALTCAALRRHIEMRPARRTCRTHPHFNRAKNNYNEEHGIMWKVGDVEPVRVMGAEGYPYGFDVTTEDGQPIVSFAYASRALAEAAATHLGSALLSALSVRPHAD